MIKFCISDFFFGGIFLTYLALKPIQLIKAKNGTLFSPFITTTTTKICSLSIKRLRLVSPRLPRGTASVSRFLLPGGPLQAKMDNFNLQQKAITSYEEAGGLFSISNPIGPVVCPKPQRVGILANSPIRPLWWQMSHQAETCDSKAGADLLDIILTKECHGAEHQSQAAFSPPFFHGSPPIRTANPLIQDARFADETPSLIPSPSGLSSPSSSSARKGGCARMKFGLKPAAVRVEGFDCLNRDRQNSRIPAVA